VFAGRLRQAVTEAERAYGEALERGPDWAAGFVGGLLGVALRAQGRARSASRLLSQGLRRFARPTSGASFWAF
jgi:hypothetical protein